MQRHGELQSDATGQHLAVTRALPVPVEEAWTWITQPDRTAQWYGPWTGDGRVGAMIMVTMAEEEGAPEAPMLIDACAAPELLRLISTSPAPWDWHMELVCAPEGEGSTVTLRHLNVSPDLNLGEIGPGWEFYLDRLVGAVTGVPAQPFEEYLQALADEYNTLR